MAYNFKVTELTNDRSLKVLSAIYKKSQLWKNFDKNFSKYKCNEEFTCLEMSQLKKQKRLTI